MSDQSNTQKTLRGVSSQTVVTIVLGVVEVIAFSVMSRLLTKDDFGYYAVVCAISAVFSCLADAGIGSAIIQRKNSDSHFINVAFTLSLIFGLSAMALMMATSHFFAKLVVDESMTLPIILLAITLPFNCVASVNNSILYKRLEFLRVGVINLISLAVTTIIAVLLAYNNWGYYAILCKAILGSVITMILSFIFAKTKYRIYLDWNLTKSILGFSGWLTLSVFFRNLAQQLDRLLISKLLSITQLGAYNRPKEFIISMTNRVNGIFDTALFPVLSEIQDDETRIVSAYKRSLYYMNIFSLFLASLFVFNSELIIRVFFGDKWLSTQVLFVILSISIIFDTDARLADCFIRSLGWTKQQFFFRILEVAFSLVGVLIGSLWGVVGIAIAYVLVQCVTIIIKNIYIIRRLNMSVIDSIEIILSAWRYGLVFIPLLMASSFLLPHNLEGNIFLALIFCLFSALIFIFFPSIIGKRYKDDLYIKIVSPIKNKFKKYILPHD